MATDPIFAATPQNGGVIITGTETNLAVPTQSVVVYTPGAAGGKIEEIRVHAVGTNLTPTVFPGLVYLFLYDATTYHIFDTIEILATTASATAKPFQAVKTYSNLTLEIGWTLKASQSIATNASLLKVTAFAGDF